MNNTRKVSLIITLTVMSLIFLFPLFWMVVTALKRPEELATYPISIFPPAPQWIHFKQVLMGTEVTDFWLAMRNSVTLCLSTTVIVTISSALAGFGFARYKAPGKNFLFGVLLSTMMLPQLVILIPQYIVFAKLGLLTLSYPFCFLPWWLDAAPGWAIFIFYYRQFFASLPKELEDAALIDGCGRLRTFWQIFFPLAGPAITTTCIFSLQWLYSDYIKPLIFLANENQTLAVQMISNVKIPGVSFTLPLPQIPYQMTVGVLFTLPLLIMFFIAQRYFMQSLATTGLKE
ncbi:MAG: carbohydrate ABC transporter permease [Bacteroidota bacterium]